MVRKVHRKTHRKHRRASSRKMRIPGLNTTVRTVKTIGKKSASGVKQGFSGVFGFLKSGFGLAFDAANEGVKQGSKLIASKKTRKHRRKH
jgi:hypothetical protein